MRVYGTLHRLLVVLPLVVSAVALYTAPASPQSASAPASAVAAGEAQLEKDVQNPIADLTSVPLQNNINFAYGSFNRTQDMLNIQPVIPIELSSNWMIVTRTILPLIWQPYGDQNTGGVYGLGDITASFFLAPRNESKLTWGVGPAIDIPTATDDILGAGKLSVGPSAVAVIQPKNWTIGEISNNVWSVAGSGGRPPVNSFYLQWFVVRQLGKGWYMNCAPTVTANWREPSGSVWTVPMGMGAGRVTKLGSQRVNIQVGFYGNILYPAGGSPWTMRIQFVFLFPRS